MNRAEFKKFDRAVRTSGRITNGESPMELICDEMNVYYTTDEVDCTDTEGEINMVGCLSWYRGGCGNRLSRLETVMGMTRFAISEHVHCGAGAVLYFKEMALKAWARYEASYLSREGLRFSNRLSAGKGPHVGAI